jgi:endonuclease/exonuclease/phosphatase family metal-dependent hydrolase
MGLGRCLNANVRKLIFVVAALVAGWSAPRAEAATLLTELFNYTDGPLITVSGGTWIHHSGTTTGEVKVVSGRALISQTNAEDVSIQLPGQPYSASTNVLLYASFTINFATLPTSNGTYFAHFKDSGASNFRDKIFAQTTNVPAGYYRVGVANASNSPVFVLTNNLALNTDYTLVTRYAPSNGVSSLWINPGAETDPSVTATDTVTTVSITTFALRESLSSGDGMGTLFFDNLVVGTAFADVISNVSIPPSITNQPQSQIVTEGDNVTFTITAGGTAPLAYQWQFSGTNLAGATDSVLNLTAVTTNQGGPYSVAITNAAGATNSQAALLTVNPAVQGPPVITAQPQGLTVNQGDNAALSVTSSGTKPLSYQWQLNGIDLSGATSNILMLTGVTTNQAGDYSVVVTNSLGATNSQPATLTVIPPPQPPFITEQPQGQIVHEGDDVTIAVTAAGSLPLGYQWRFNGTNLPGATDSILLLTDVTTNQGGSYAVSITNFLGSTNSLPAVLTINPAARQIPALTLMTYNLHGNGATNWSTNSPQIQAIGRELMYLQPDVVSFNEIPNGYNSDMTNLVATYLPGYSLVISTHTDNFIRSGVAARYPILAAISWLYRADLTPFGSTNHLFTRDLFQAQVSVPNFPQPLDVFVAHLKATVSTPYDDATKRAAESGAISNFFVTTYLPGTNGLHPYVLAGDMNEDVYRPETNHYVSGQPIQKLTSPSTGLQLTTPLNPFTHSDLTESIQSTLNVRFDYILPVGFLFSNIVSSQVFRTDLLTNPPPPLLTNDDRTASDHLPAVMVFANPYDRPFHLLSFQITNQTAALTWESVRGQPYRVEVSSNLSTWSVLAGNITATSSVSSFATNVNDRYKYFRVYRVP